MAAAFVLCAAPTLYGAPRQQEDPGTIVVAPSPNGQDPQKPVGIVTRVATEITIDGSLDEAVWRSAPRLSGLIQREPRTGEQPMERTDVTLLPTFGRRNRSVSRSDSV